MQLLTFPASPQVSASKIQVDHAQVGIGTNRGERR
jgi:hypothetical protein